MPDDPQSNPEEPQQEQGPPDAVLVHVRRQEDGKIVAISEPMGDVRPSEVESILGTALTYWRQTNGLPR